LGGVVRPGAAGGIHPDTIWVDDPDGPGFTTVSRHEDPAWWEAVVVANEPVIIQINLGDPHVEGGQDLSSSSSSQSSIVADKLDVLDP
jgi:hypothetical protein